MSSRGAAGSVSTTHGRRGSSGSTGSDRGRGGGGAHSSSRRGGSSARGGKGGGPSDRGGKKPTGASRYEKVGIVSQSPQPSEAKEEIHSTVESPVATTPTSVPSPAGSASTPSTQPVAKPKFSYAHAARKSSQTSAQIPTPIESEASTSPAEKVESQSDVSSDRITREESPQSQASISLDGNADNPPLPSDRNKKEEVKPPIGNITHVPAKEKPLVTAPKPVVPSGLHADAPVFNPNTPVFTPQKPPQTSNPTPISTVPFKSNTSTAPFDIPIRTGSAPPEIKPDGPKPKNYVPYRTNQPTYGPYNMTAAPPTRFAAISNQPRYPSALPSSVVQTNSSSVVSDTKSAPDQRNKVIEVSTDHPTPEIPSIKSPPRAPSDSLIPTADQIRQDRPPASFDQSQAPRPGRVIQYQARGLPPPFMPNPYVSYPTGYVPPYVVSAQPPVSTVQPKATLPVIPPPKVSKAHIIFRPDGKPLEIYNDANLPSSTDSVSEETSSKVQDSGKEDHKATEASLPVSFSIEDKPEATIEVTLQENEPKTQEKGVKATSDTQLGNNARVSLTDLIEDAFRDENEDEFDALVEDGKEDEEDAGLFFYEVDFLLTLRELFTSVPEGFDVKAACVKGGSGTRPPEIGLSGRKSSSLSSQMFRRSSSRSGMGKGSTSRRGQISSLKMGRRGNSGRVGSKTVRHKLSVSGNAWKRTRPANEVEDLKRKVFARLNKLTVEKFDTISTQLIDLVKENVSDSVTLGIVVQLVFEKALIEPKFSFMYANLCETLQKNFPVFKEVVVNENTGEEKEINRNLSRILLTECQRNFQQGITEIVNDGTKSEGELAELRHKQKLRWLGLVVFIGHLFQRGMLTTNVIGVCIRSLLLETGQIPTEEELEALVKLLTTVGLKLENLTGSSSLDLVFRKIDELIQNKKDVSSRMRFLLMDLVDLRKNNWEPRRKEAQATKLGDVGKDTAQSRKARIDSSAQLAPQQPPRPRTMSAIQPATPTSSKSSTSTPRHLVSNSAASSRKGTATETVSEIPSESTERVDPKLESKVKNIFAEYMNHGIIEESLLDFKDLDSKYGFNCEKYSPYVVETFLLQSIEQKDPEKALDKSKKLLVSLIREKSISSNHALIGLKKVLLSFEDLKNDCPKLGEYLGRFIGGLIHSTVVKFEDLVFLWERNLVRNQTLQDLIVDVLAYLRNLLSTSEFSELIRSERIDLSLFLTSPYWVGYRTFLDTVNLTEQFSLELDFCDELGRLWVGKDCSKLVAKLKSNGGVIHKSSVLRFSLEQIYQEKVKNDADENYWKLTKQKLKLIRPVIETLANDKESQLILMYELQKFSRKVKKFEEYLCRCLKDLFELKLVDSSLVQEWYDCEFFSIGKPDKKILGILR